MRFCEQDLTHFWDTTGEKTPDKQTQFRATNVNSAKTTFVLSLWQMKELRK
jgi:hypothetical protein